MKRYKHNRGGYHLLTGHMGELYPVGLVEVTPNESVEHSVSAVIRLSPMAAPVMHPVTVRIHNFFVSLRNAWGDDCGKAFEDFITGGPNNDNATVLPVISAARQKNDLLDYLGVPAVDGSSINALPVRAFNQCWNEYYRDQDLQAERGKDDITVPNCAWEKDQFTASRPWPQKGPTVTLPIAGSAPVKGIGRANTNWQTGPVTAIESDGTSRDYAEYAQSNDPNYANVVERNSLGAHPNIYADLTAASSVPVTELRRALALQRIGEQRARYGSRYTEYMRYSFGARPGDARLQRPEFLGGGRVRLAIREVLQTAPEATPSRFGVGDMYGHGIGAVRSNSYRYHANEWGYILTLLSVRPKTMYMDGVDRLWLRRDREDFFQRELQYIGQQEVKQGEIKFAASGNHNVFGYNDKYSEYRRQRSRVSAEFRNELKYWHLGRDFEASSPALNEDFIKCVPSKRIFNVQSRHTLWMMVQHQMVTRSTVDRSAYGKII